MRGGIALASLSLAAVLLGGCATTSSQQESSKSDSTKRSGIYLDLGVAYLSQGKPRKALRTLEKARNLHEDDARVYNALALTYESLGFDDKAQGAYEEAVDLDPKDPEVRNNYGVFLAQMGSYERARKQFEKALADPLYNNPETAYYNLGWIARRQGDTEEAKGMLRTALRLRSQYPQARLTLVQILQERGELAQAGKEVATLLNRNPENVQGHKLAGEVALARGQQEAAREHLRKVVELAPETDAAQRSQALLDQIEPREGSG